jgi:hypothetical protein
VPQSWQRYPSRASTCERARDTTLTAEAASTEAFHCHFRTSSVTVVVRVKPPPLAVMVILWFPSAALLPTLTVMVEVPEPGAAMLLELKVTV